MQQLDPGEGKTKRAYTVSYTHLDVYKRQLNANLLWNWVQAHRDRQAVGVPMRLGRDDRTEPAHCSPPTLVPVSLQTEDAPSCGGIQIEIRRQETVFQITWPASEVAVCAQWLREVLG